MSIERRPKELIILLDLDGVCVNFVKGANKIHGIDLVWDVWSPWKRYGLTSEEFWKPINNGGYEFWRQLEEYQWFEILVSRLQSIPNSKLYFCTSPSLDAHAVGGKIQWLKDRFGFEFYDYIITGHKHLLANSHTVLIDDSDSQCQRFEEAGGISVLFPQPWNMRKLHLQNGRDEIIKGIIRDVSYISSKNPSLLQIATS